MSANAAAQMINHADNKLTRIEKHLSSHVDNGELLTASVARVALLEEKLTTLSAQIESLEEKLEPSRARRPPLCSGAAVRGARACAAVCR